MGLFDKLFKNKEVHMQGPWKSLTAYRPVFSSWNESIYESEMVRAAIHARATHISKMRVICNDDVRAKFRKQIETRPNSFQTWSQFLYRASTILDMQNTVFIVPVLDAYREVEGYFPILPTRCEVVNHGGQPWLRYQFMSGQTGAMEMSKCAVMTKFQYQSDFFGENNRALSPTLSLISMQNQGIEEGVRSAATYRFMARVNNFTNDKDLKKERERFSRENFESEGGGVLLFPNSYTDIKQITGTPFTIDANQMNAIKQNVFNYFGVNEEILQNKAYGDAWTAFYEGAIEPFAIQFTDAVNNLTFGDSKAKIMLTANRLQYMSNGDKLNMSAQLMDRGIMNRNEIRETWNLGPIPGGDTYFIRGEYYADKEKGGTEGGNGNGQTSEGKA